MAGLRMCLRTGIRTVIGLTVLCLLGSSELFAQAGPAPHNKPNQGLRPSRQMVVKALRADMFETATGPQEFDDYFVNFVFPQFLEEENRTNLLRLPQLRRDLKNFYFVPGQQGVVHDRLVELTHNWMKAVIVGQWQTIFKYNAMLVIGDLNQKEAQPQVGPVPYPGALATMLLVVNSNKFDSQDYLRFAAMIGIERHAESHGYSPIGGNSVASITAAMLPIAQQQSSPIKRSVEGHNWYRRSALQILGAIGDPGSNGAVVTALEAAATDPKSVLALRLAAAESLARIKYGGLKVDYGRVAKEIGDVVCDVCDYQLAEHAKDQSYELKRVLRSNLGPVREALNSPGRPSLVTSSNGSPQQATVIAITAKIDDICKFCDNEKNDDKSVSAGIGAKLDALKALVGAGAPAAPASSPVAPTAPAAATPVASGAQVAPSPATGRPATAAPSAPLSAGADGTSTPPGAP